jgi:hypothetical protein
MLDARFEAGKDVGELAKHLFGDKYEDVTVLQPDGYPDTTAMLSRTYELMTKETPVICEAAFDFNGCYCAVDILRKTETGYDFYEVKNAPEVHEQFIRDAGFQYYIMTRCKLKIGRICIVTHGEDEENPFVINDVTSKAKSYYRWINDNIWDLNRMQKEREEIMAEPGDQCMNPYECWYYGYCHPEKA